VEVSKVGSLLFLSGTLPLVDSKLAISAQIFRSISGREAARLASLNALTAAQEHVGDLNAKGKS
jgi:hypothetical protein